MDSVMLLFSVLCLLNWIIVEFGADAVVKDDPS
jgi:hypothetical protein